jgi:hypothetical protein
MSREKLTRWLDLLLLVLTLGFGVVFVLFEVFATDTTPAVVERFDIGFTVAFLVLFSPQCALARDRVAWLRANWFDVLIVAIVAFPLLRALRFYRYLPRAFGLLRLAAILTEALRAISAPTAGATSTTSWWPGSS